MEEAPAWRGHPFLGPAIFREDSLFAYEQNFLKSATQIQRCVDAIALGVGLYSSLFFVAATVASSLATAEAIKIRALKTAGSVLAFVAQEKGYRCRRLGVANGPTRGMCSGRLPGIGPQGRVKGDFDPTTIFGLRFVVPLPER